MITYCDLPLKRSRIEGSVGRSLRSDPERRKCIKEKTIYYWSNHRGIRGAQMDQQSRIDSIYIVAFCNLTRQSGWIQSMINRNLCAYESSLAWSKGQHRHGFQDGRGRRQPLDPACVARYVSLTWRSAGFETDSNLVSWEARFCPLRVAAGTVKWNVIIWKHHSGKILILCTSHRYGSKSNPQNPLEPLGTTRPAENRLAWSCMKGVDPEAVHLSASWHTELPFSVQKSLSCILRHKRQGKFQIHWNNVE